MKKAASTLLLIIIVSFMFTACKNKAEKKTVGIEANAEFKCLMDCEDGKTYSEEGKCPVCGMALNSTENNKTCKHLVDGECQCEEGKCECEDCSIKNHKEDKSDKKTCKHLVDGECQCEEGKCDCEDCTVKSDQEHEYKHEHNIEREH